MRLLSNSQNRQIPFLFFRGSGPHYADHYYAHDVDILESDIEWITHNSKVLQTKQHSGSLYTGQCKNYTPALEWIVNYTSVLPLYTRHRSLDTPRYDSIK